ncbi:dTDP-4-dehydrorhamnose reductase [Bergeyella sp. RCAD1439]|uniref:dTDP-4-dehydrorhamnose reductase n=1 Tax=Bergeyella anatis TaxID=3113737 RepID=UPI002E193CBE|nr:dTDP-4-dehydrorhamnose reductase [Bergeyella sp. RCAD1439]
MNKILVVGGNGQLGHCLRKLAEDCRFGDYAFDFTDSDTLDITDASAVEDYFAQSRPNYCINASAYTAVDLAETEVDKAYAVNAEGVGCLAEACRRFGAVLVHVSTDYVFDGDTSISYSEDDRTNPLGVYGASKLKGEQLAMELNPKTIILRTSWLYSEFNKNFVKTMLSLFETREELNVVADQYGQPTNANDLAEVIMKVIASPSKSYGVFHFSNYSETTWYEFASKIAALSGSSIKLNPITTDQYPTPAKRPARSTMALDKIEKLYGVEPKHWEHSLEECIEILRSEKK